MNESEWKTFLTEYNHELLSYEQVVEALSRELIKEGWLGYAGAAERALVAAEKRLATSIEVVSSRLNGCIGGGLKPELECTKSVQRRFSGDEFGAI